MCCNPVNIKSKLSYMQWHINLRKHLLSLHSIVSSGLGCFITPSVWKACEVVFSSSVCLHVLWGHFRVCCRSYNAPSRACWPALVCPPELQLASKRSCRLMIMNAACLLNVLSGLTVILFHLDSGYRLLVHCSLCKKDSWFSRDREPSAITMSLWPCGPSQMNAL